MVIAANACLKGWRGATCNGIATVGVWSIQERDHHINLEMNAVFLGLKTFCQPSGKHSHKGPLR